MNLQITYMESINYIRQLDNKSQAFLYDIQKR
jgi:hypothetical protein